MPVQGVVEEHYTVQDLAEAWNVSNDTVRRLFQQEGGVIVISRTRRRTRVYKTLRIPHTVAERVYHRLQQNGGAR